MEGERVFGARQRREAEGSEREKAKDRERGRYYKCVTDVLCMHGFIV